MILIYIIYSGYGAAFNAQESFFLSDGIGFRKSGIIFGADMSSSVLIVNRNKYILVLSKRLTDGLDNTALTVEKQYLINFTEQHKKHEFAL